MKIWIDARICSEQWCYSSFISELISEFLAIDQDNEFVVYTKKNLPGKRWSLLQDIKAKKIFESENFALMIFFDYHIPHGYKWDYFVMTEHLKEVFFPKKRWIHRAIFKYKLKKALSHSAKALVLDWWTAMELNENLDISEETIRKIHGFFPHYKKPDWSALTIDIKAKHNLRWDYLIYDSGNELHNNFDRILKAFKKIQEKWVTLYLLVICESTTKDIDIRNKVLDYWVSGTTLFLWEVPSWEEHSYYTQSKGVIFSSIYESFPFHFSKAIAYKSTIFANDIPANRAVMWDTISYLDPLSIYNMCDTILESINSSKTAEYSNIESSLSPNLSAQELLTLVEGKN